MRQNQKTTNKGRSQNFASKTTKTQCSRHYIYKILSATIVSHRLFLIWTSTGFLLKNLRKDHNRKNHNRKITSENFCKIKWPKLSVNKYNKQRKNIEPTKIKGIREFLLQRLVPITWWQKMTAKRRQLKNLFIEANLKLIRYK